MEYEERRRKEIKEGVVAFIQFIMICAILFTLLCLLYCGMHGLSMYLSTNPPMVVRILIAFVLFVVLTFGATIF